MMWRLPIFLILILIPPLVLADSPADQGKELYMRHCSFCHHPERIGIKAPPLIPETLKGYSRERLAEIISEGLPSTQMPRFRDLLDEKEIGEVISYITSPAPHVQWGMKEISESREIHKESASGEGTGNLQNTYGLIREYRLEEPGRGRKISNIDPEDITLVVESGKGVTVMDGQAFKILDKFETGAIHGGPKFSHSLRYVYAATRDGIVTRYDLNNLTVTGKVRAGINTRNIAVSHDDRYIAVANYLPGNIVILDGDLNPMKIIDVNGKIGGVYLLNGGRRFLCSFRDKNELWLIDYEKDFSIERLPLPEAFEDMAISPIEDTVIGASRSGERVYIYGLREEKVLGSIPTGGMPHLASAAFWVNEKGVPYAAVNHLKAPMLTVIDLGEMKVSKELRLLGSGYFVRTHQNTPYLWVDTNSEELQIIDKKNLRTVGSLRPAAGKKAMHTEFTKDGRYAMVSVWEDEGAVVVYDAYKLKEVKRIPFRKPAGKYNAYNKTFPDRAYRKENMSSVLNAGGLKGSETSSE